MHPSTSSYHYRRRVPHAERARTPMYDAYPSAIEHSLIQGSPMAQRRHPFPPLQRAHRSFDGTELLSSLDAVPCTVHEQLPFSKPNSNTCWPGTSSDFGGMPAMSATALQQENEMLRRDYEVAVQKLNSTMNSIRTFWSPELKRERQLRKEEVQRLQALQARRPEMLDGVDDSRAQLESARQELVARDRSMRQLLAALHGKGIDGASLVRLAELETRCAQLEALNANREHQLRAALKQADNLNRQDAFSAFTAKVSISRGVIVLKDARIVELEEELLRARQAAAREPRDYTDKTLSAQEMHTLQMKLERSEVELSSRRAELLACQGRLQAAQEQLEELSKHLRLSKEAGQARHQQNILLTGDVEALRSKLETKNEALTQKKANIDKLQADLNQANAMLADRNEALKSSEQRAAQLSARIETLEMVVHDRDAQLERLKTHMQKLPDVLAEKASQARIDQLQADLARAQQDATSSKQNSERDRQHQLESFRREESELRATLESLQKELADRQVLLESQNEKIGDLNRELAIARNSASALAISGKRGSDNRVISNGLAESGDEASELRAELAQARAEVDRLLKMVQNADREKVNLASQCKQLQNNVALLQQDGSTVSHSRTEPSSFRSRVEELEEALRESVSITAERELHVAQQKQLNQQLNMQLLECRREIADLRATANFAGGGVSGDKEALLRSFEAERRKHLDQLYQLKQEALMAAIGEKEAHIALLESNRDRPDAEIDALRRHKMGLMNKLQEENERRQHLLTPMLDAAAVPPGAALASVLPGAMFHSSGLDQEDDAEGIWA